MEIFMAPRSVAVIGATRRTGPGSFNVIENMMAYGYDGKIYPVNPLADRIVGLKTYRDVKDIEAFVDLAVIAVPRDLIPRVLEDCADQGIGGAIIVPQGFADADGQGRDLQEQLRQIRNHRGIRILGPNTLGVVDAFSGFSSSFMPIKREKVPVGVICQSGIFFVGSSVFTGMIGKGVDVGNACDLDFADALEWFEDDDDIKVIFLHIEGLIDGERFFKVAKRVARSKPIIALKTASSRQGARAALSHSGSMVGHHAVFEAAFRQSGIISTSDPEAVLDFTKAFLHLNPMFGNRVGLITFSGAGGIILIDNLEQYGLEVVELSPDTIREIKDLSPEWMPIQNPLDIWPALMKHGMNRVYGIALRETLGDPAVDGVICIAIAPDLPDHADLDATDVIRETAASMKEKPVVAFLYGPNQDTVSRKLEEGGSVMALPSLPRAARVLAALYERGRFLRRVSTDS